MINLNLTEITVKREIRLLRVKLELSLETIQFIKLYPRFINSFVLSNRPANRRNLKNTNYYTPIGTKRNDALFSLSPSFLFSLSFFLSRPFKFAEIAYQKRKIEPSPFSTRAEQLAPRSVAVRTIIAAWIIAESNNKRPWSPHVSLSWFNRAT